MLDFGHNTYLFLRESCEFFKHNYFRYIFTSYTNCTTYPHSLLKCSELHGSTWLGPSSIYIFFCLPHPDWSSRTLSWLFPPMGFLHLVPKSVLPSSILYSLPWLVITNWGISACHTQNINISCNSYLNKCQRLLAAARLKQAFHSGDLFFALLRAVEISSLKFLLSVLECYQS